MPRPRMTYARAGVDIDKVSRAHRAIARKLERTFRTRRGKIGRPIFPIGHYAGLVDIGHDKVLSLHTDNVGTKMIIAHMMRKFDTVGIDCVAMCANDLICTGSEPIAFLDHISLARPDHAIVGQIADGIAKGAEEAGMAVIGGETAITPDLLQGQVGDLIGMAVGICSRGELVLGDKVRKGDALVGVASSGIHSNGLTLARKVLLRTHSLREKVPGSERTIGQELLEPTRIYVKPVMELLRKSEVHGLAHITGGAFSKLDRIVSQAKLGATLEDFPPTPEIFRFIQKKGRISESEMYRTFNMGIGLIAICPDSKVERAIRIFRRHGQEAFKLGRVVGRNGVRVKGTLVS